ncbi:hypothetical protein HAZT_HAZT009215 [Hyalella azteca]|uniref:MACPF domain-containing protein n=1 Tax=Hyalella azteca TaxID=294128 RepID=A0A6A0GST9_HYAAZ|nr:hypothetical protein HAZT_HAZT009215 [Hyalella azteca]
MMSSRLLLPASVLVLMLLRLHVSLANTMWFHTGSDKKIPPVTNFKLSLRGYDVLLADPWQAEDPGFGDQIFEPFYTQNGRTYFYSFIDEVEINTKCNTKFTFSHISNSTEYLNEKFSDYSFVLGAFNNENNESVFSDESHRSGLPKQWHQEMVIGRAKCLTHRVQIAPFEKPVFTENFRNALRVLHEAAKDPMSVRSRETMMMFFLTFGTHFMKTVELGSKVVMWKTVSGQERSLDLKCLENSIDETVKKSNGNTASASSNFRTHSSQCDMKDGNEIPTSAEVDNGADMLITGIFPNKTMDTWNLIAKASPRPIGAELVKISYFFRDQWMDFIGENTTTTLDTEAMYELYEIGLSYYCHKILKKNCKTSTLEELKNVANTRVAIAAGTNELRFQSDQPYGTAMLLQGKL